MSNPSLDAHVNVCGECQAVLDRIAQEDPATKAPVSLRVPGPEDLPRIPGFEIKRELGRGGMGVVYLANELNTDRSVALKFVTSGPFALPSDRARWLREARAAARIGHPHIVQVHRADEARGWLYLMLEYVRGGSLKERLTGPISPRVAATLLLPIARALEELHRAGIWHLDLKPANILIDAAPGTPLDLAPLKLTDFGIARSGGDSDATGSSRGGAQGTLLYMAPEQVAGRRSALGPATDIHAVGIILYEMVTGRPPFLADSNAETIRQIEAQDPVPPRRLNSKVPRDFEVLCLKCLEKEPHRRYTSAAALAEDLHRFLGGDPISARPASSFEKARRLCRNHPAVASLMAAVTLTGVGGFMGLFALWRISETARARVELERARAEEARMLSEDNEKLASRALSEVSGVLFYALDRPEALSEDRILGLTYLLKEQTSKLRSSRGVGPWNLPGVGVLERMMAARLFSRGKREEARLLVADSVACLTECRQREPDNERITWQLAESFWLSGYLAANEHRIDEALDFCDRASSLLDALRTLVFRVDMTKRLYLMRGSLSDELTRRGEPERARQVIETSLRTFDSMEDIVKEQPELAVCKELTLVKLTTGYRAIERLQSVVRKFPDDPDLRRELERRITAWLTVNPFTNRTHSGSTIYEDDPNAWAEALVRLIRTQCSAQGLDASAVLIHGTKLSGFAHVAAAEQRKTGQLEGADLTARRLMAVARTLLKDYPSQPEPHMILGEAYLQLSKNAWERKDRPAIEHSLRQALASARHAVKLNPNREDARDLVDRLLPRLIPFETGRTEPN